MKIFRCRICGETYLGFEKPSNCPFCGAHEAFMVPGVEWKEENVGVELTDVSRRNLEEALGLEVSNASFYYCASQRASDVEVEGMFKRLFKVEAEHASLISKLLGVPKPDVTKVKEGCSQSDIENIKESRRREERASSFYAQSASEASEARVREVFLALVEIEKDHLELDQIELERLSS
jgi:rubrerythrin